MLWTSYEQLQRDIYVRTVGLAKTIYSDVTQLCCLLVKLASVEEVSMNPLCSAWLLKFYFALGVSLFEAKTFTYLVCCYETLLSRTLSSFCAAVLQCCTWTFCVSNTGRVCCTDCRYRQHLILLLTLLHSVPMRNVHFLLGMSWSVLLLFL